MALGILGGVFDPPHMGHLALARAAIRELGLDELLVLVVADPGHKSATTPPRRGSSSRGSLSRTFPKAVVELDPHARTVDSLEERRPSDAVFILGADELADFESWKSPERVLELVRLGVAMRPGVSGDDVQAVRERLGAGDRSLEFALEPVPISSSRDPRARGARARRSTSSCRRGSRRRSRVSASTQTPE